MHELEKRIERVVGENNMIRLHEKVVVGVSGGGDSIALLNILGSMSAKLKCTIIAAYLDHGLRPAESEKECELVCCEAAKIGADFEHGAVDVRRFARRTNVSIEDGARQLRYEFLKTIAKKYQAGKVAVAHNADDQAEEILLRLIRGSGRKGLSGMDLVRDDWLIRPLLGVSKEEILAYLHSRNLTFCHDSSNSDLAYLRNRVRLELLPYLASHYHAGIKKVLRQEAAILGAEDQVLDNLTEAAYAKIVKGVNPAILSLAKFSEEYIAIQRRIVEKILLGMAGQPGFRQIEQILQLVKSGKDGGQIHLAMGLRGVIDKDVLIFSYPAGFTCERGDLQDKEPEPFDVVINRPGTFRLNNEQSVTVEYMKKVPNPQELCYGRGDCLDASRLSFPFKCRNRLPGDKFYPLGGPGRIKVGDFLGNLKVSKGHRGKVIVVERGREIAALLELRIANQFRIRQTTKAVLRITVQPSFFQ